MKIESIQQFNNYTKVQNNHKQTLGDCRNNQNYLLQYKKVPSFRGTDMGTVKLVIYSAFSFIAVGTCALIGEAIGSFGIGALVGGILSAKGIYDAEK